MTSTYIVFTQVFKLNLQGAGKSSLISIIQGLYLQTQINKQVNSFYIPQNPLVLPFDIQENLNPYKRISEKGAKDARMRNFKNKYLRELSGQEIMLMNRLRGQLCVRHPELLIIDEGEEIEYQPLILITHRKHGLKEIKLKKRIFKQ